MLPVLNAISFVRQFKKHSRTQPWVVLANDNDSAPQSFVVKLYTREENELRNAVAKEVFCNVIAGHLGLARPEAALIDFYSNDFMSILDHDELQTINMKDYRIKFATRLIQNHTQFPEQMNHQFLMQFTKIDSIFAFDNFVMNTDRNLGKPNVLINGRTIMLIDHEYTLDITQKVLDEFDAGTWAYKCVKHILYDFLISRYRTHFFDEFAETLASFNPDVLDPYADQLVGLGYDPAYGNYMLLKKYLNKIKNNPVKFANLLKAKVK